MKQNKLGIVLLVTLTAVYGQGIPHTCDSEIYCYGELLHTVQMARIFRDSKTFVDMKMKNESTIILERFQQFMNRTRYNPTSLDVQEFVSANFDDAGSEFEPYEPRDWKENPAFFDRVIDPHYKNWAEKLNSLWKFLGRKMKDEVKNNQDLYSIIYVPHPVIVPGGRFREFYYWDSYWIVRGLLLSEMHSTVKGMLENFLSIVERFGYIPNGGRVYYAMRSQPPLLIPMIDSYFGVTNDLTFIKEHIGVMDKEFQHWIVNHTKNITKDGETYTLARYKDNSVGPRPESYWEDYHSASVLRSESEREDYYAELKAAAESGWDFSSRWFIANKTNKGSLLDMKVRSIIPVDLNAILYWNAQILAKFHKLVGNLQQSEMYTNLAKDWLKAVTSVLWHEEVGVWLDYDSSNEIKRDYFYPSNISPLWTGCYNISEKDQYVGKVLKYLQHSQIMINAGGIPTTLEHSGEQWDYPNAWPPLQHIMIEGLDLTGDPWAKELAFKIAEKWVRSNFVAFNATQAMYEKYDATIRGGHGGGGEYEVQMGFGWTNGVIMALLDKYGENLTIQDKFENTNHSVAAASASTESQVLAALLAFLATLAAGSIGLMMYKKRAQTTPISKRKRTICPKFFGDYTELKDLTLD